RATKEMRARTAFMRRTYSQPESVLELRRPPVEARHVVSVEAAEPPAADHEKQVVSGLQDPAETALESEDPRWAIVLHEVGPRDVRRGVVVQAPGVELRDEVPLWQRALVSLHLQDHGQVDARLQ